MSQIWCFPLSRSKGADGEYLRSSYCILIALNNLVATLVVLPFGSDLAPTCYSTRASIALKPTQLKVTLPCPYHILIQGGALEASKLQRPLPIQCGTIVTDDTGGVCTWILLSTQDATLTWDWQRITIGNAEGSNWWYRSGMTCACNHEVLIGSHP